MRLVDADVADKWMRQNNAFIDAAILKAIPTIYAVPVVRCRECVNTIPDGNGKPYCRWLELYIKDLNFFCRDGQRKIETVLPINDTKDENLEADHD